MRLSPHTIRALRIEKAARTVIWMFVILTVVVLAWIILYVLFRGFYARNESVSVIAPYAEKTVTSSDFPDQELIFIVHPGVRLKEMGLDGLRSIYTKRRNYWGPYTGQNLQVQPFIYQEGSRLRQSADCLLLRDSTGYSANIRQLSSSREMIIRVAATPGGVGLIPADDAELLAGKPVKQLAVRRICFPVHPGVLEIVANIRLGDLKTGQLTEIFTGRTSDWQAMGGIELPIKPVVIGDHDPRRSHLRALVRGSAPSGPGPVKVVSNVAEMFAWLDVTPGAVGICYYDDLESGAENLLEISSVRSGFNLTLHYLIEAPAESGAWGGISTIIINTLLLILFTLLFSVPVGVFAAVYLVEYAKQTRLIAVLRLGTETLAGIPSIVFGLFGFLFFVARLKLGIGFLSAVLTVTMMILPTVIRTGEEALKAVPMAFREGSLALGATRLQTIFKVVLPAASPGILSGVILALGRTVGETAVLLFTLGSNYELVRGPSSSARVLSLHLYNMFAEGISFDRCFATGTVLIVIILLVNYATTKLIGRLHRKAGKLEN